MPGSVEPQDAQARLPWQPAVRIPVSPSEAVQLLASQSFALTGEVYQLVTFLNRSLQDQHLEFGLRRQRDGRYQLAVYQVHDPAPDAPAIRPLDTGQQPQVQGTAGPSRTEE